MSFMQLGKENSFGDKKQRTFVLGGDVFKPNLTEECDVLQLKRAEKKLKIL